MSQVRIVSSCCHGGGGGKWPYAMGCCCANGGGWLTGGPWDPGIGWRGAMAIGGGSGR